MRTDIYRTAMVVIVLLAIGLPSASGGTGATLTLSDGIPGQGNPTDSPTIVLRNDSTSANITDIVLSIGDTGYNFDAVWWVTNPFSLGYEVETPDTGPLGTDGGVRSDEIVLRFVGSTSYSGVSTTAFAPGLSFQFQADLDPDADNVVTDYKSILFDVNGSSSADNSALTVTFSGGDVLQGQLPDFAADPGNVYVFTIPEPCTLSLILLSGAVAVMRRRR